jgi:hypothetical protein
LVRVKGTAENCSTFHGFKEQLYLKFAADADFAALLNPVSFILIP